MLWTQREECRFQQSLGNDYHGEEVDSEQGALAGSVHRKRGTNQDWEDVTSDGVNLYIADMGNNRNARRNLGIYVVPWDSLSDTQAATATRFIPVYYPEQTGFPPLERHFDSESLFFADGSLYAIHQASATGSDSASRQPGANLYQT